MKSPTIPVHITTPQHAGKSDSTPEGLDPPRLFLISCGQSLVTGWLGYSSHHNNHRYIRAMPRSRREPAGRNNRTGIHRSKVQWPQLSGRQHSLYLPMAASLLSLRTLSIFRVIASGQAAEAPTPPGGFLPLLSDDLPIRIWVISWTAP